MQDINFTITLKVATVIGTILFASAWVHYLEDFACVLYWSVSVFHYLHEVLCIFLYPLFPLYVFWYFLEIDLLVCQILCNLLQIAGIKYLFFLLMFGDSALEVNFHKICHFDSIFSYYTINNNFICR